VPAAKQASGRSVKIAIDFPAPLFHETEKAVQELSTTRSSLIRTAVEAFLRNRQRAKLERQLAESFEANAELDRQLMDDFRHVDAESF
jgi:metal-responsive CopG/Arc/MetJ family transcriptional regulator